MCALRRTCARLLNAIANDVALSSRSCQCRLVRSGSRRDDAAYLLRDDNPVTPARRERGEQRAVRVDKSADKHTHTYTHTQNTHVAHTNTPRRIDSNPVQKHGMCVIATLCSLPYDRAQIVTHTNTKFAHTCKYVVRMDSNSLLRVLYRFSG